MECMNCKGSGCMNCQGYDSPDLIARLVYLDAYITCRIRAAKAETVYLKHMQDTRRGIYCCERSERLGRVYPCANCRDRSMTDREFNERTLVYLDAHITSRGVGPSFIVSFHFLGR